MANEDATSDVRRTFAADEHLEPRPPVPKIYSAPRRFDIATMLTVSFAYSLLFGLLKSLDARWEVYLFLGTLTVVVGAAQAILYGGNKPRAASMWGGVLYLLAWTIVLALVDRQGAWICGIFACFVWGPPLGYLAGAMVGGVFLVADSVRRRIG